MNSKVSLEYSFKLDTVVRKILRSFPKIFRPKVTSIEEKKKDIDILIVEELVGSLQTFEMTLKPNVKKKGFALKIEESPNTEDDFDEEFAKVARKFKFLLMRPALGLGKSSRSTRGGAGEIYPCYGSIKVLLFILCYFMSLVGGRHMFVRVF